MGVQRIEDPHHPRGYRELRSAAEMRNLLNRKIVEQDRKCAIYHEEFTDYNDVVPDHRNPKGMGGAWRDGRIVDCEWRTFLGEIVADVLDALHEHASQFFIHKANPPVPHLSF
jgi:hypothetical protein